MAQKACLNKHIVTQNNLFTTNDKKYIIICFLTPMHVIESLMG